MTDTTSAAPSREKGWREDDSALFIDYGRAFTPERERQQAIICELVASVTPGRVVELCCGAGDLLRLLLERLPEAACAGARRLAGHAGEDSGDLRRACATGWSCKRSISQRATGGDSSRRPMRSAPRSPCITSMAKASGSCSRTCTRRCVRAASSCSPT